LNCSCRREDKRYGPARVRGSGKLSPSISPSPSPSPSSSLCCSLRLCLTGFFLLAGFLLPSGLCAQSEYVDINQNGIGAGIIIDLGGGSFSGASLAAAYSSNGILDIGIDLGIVSPRLPDITFPEYQGAIRFGFTILKQDHLMPISLLFTGALRASLAVGKEPGAGGEDLLMSGTGLGLGMDLFRFWFLRPRFYGRLGMWITHVSDTVITELESGAATADYPSSTSVRQFSGGLMAGVSWRPNTPNRGVAFSGDLRVGIDEKGIFHLLPAITVTVVSEEI
jgi:hypothetical protein